MEKSRGEEAAPGAASSLPVLQIFHRPGILDLGWGVPDPALLPVEAVRRACQECLDRFGADALQYGYSAGAGPLLEWLCARIGRQEGRAPAADEILLTGGNSQGLDLLLTLAACPSHRGAAPGDVVLVESPTYHLALRILRDHPLELVSVPADHDGLQIDALREILAGLRRAGRRARALYSVPTFNNPSGASLSAARRAALVEIAGAEGLLVIEDDVYRELAYDAPAPASLWRLAPPGVVARLGSFSKSFAPGLRLGWLTADSSLVGRLAGGGLLDSGGSLNHFASLVMTAACQAGDFDIQVDRLRAEYRARRDALLEALAGRLPPGCKIYRPAGGFFVWVDLPPGLDAGALLASAEAAGVSYVPGALFHLDGRGQAGLRLSFSLYPPDLLAEAAARLGRALRAAL